MNKASMMARGGTLGILALAVGPAFADDVAPPGYRGWEETIEVEWEFLLPFTSVDIYPDSFNAVGMPGIDLYDGFLTKAELDATSNWAWVTGDGDGGLQVTNPNGAFIAFKVQNWLTRFGLKDIRVQVTHQGAPPLITSVQPYGPNPWGYTSWLTGSTSIDASHFYEDWRIRASPAWELIEMYVPFNVVLDEVYIDTWSIMPAPSPVALLGFGLLSMGRRRRRTAA